MLTHTRFRAPIKIIKNGNDADKPLFFKRVVNRIRARPDAAGPRIQVATGTMAATVCQDTCWLIGQVLGRVNHLCLQGDFAIDMLTILNFQGFPGHFGHNSTSLDI